MRLLLLPFFLNLFLAPLLGLARGLDAICEKPDACNESVGVLTFLVDGKRHLCTATLIQPDKILTNRHCLPKDGAMSVSFPKTSTRALEHIEVQTKPVTASEVTETEVEPDWMILELNRATDRKPMPVTSSGIPFSDHTTQLISAHAERAKNGVHFGLLQTKTCTFETGTVLVPYFLNNESPIASYTGCPLEKGNSGGPLLNSQGELWGVHQMNMNWNNEGFKGLSIFHDNTTKLTQSSSVGIATNLACTEISPDPQNDFCKLDFSNYAKTVDNFFARFEDLLSQENLDQQIRAALAKKQMQNPNDNLEPVALNPFDTEENALTALVHMQFVFLPKCLSEENEDGILRLKTAKVAATLKLTDHFQTHVDASEINTVEVIGRPIENDDGNYLFFIDDKPIAEKQISKCLNLAIEPQIPPHLHP